MVSKLCEAAMVVAVLLLILCSIGCQSQVSYSYTSVQDRPLRGVLQKQCRAVPSRLRSNSASPCTVKRLNSKTLRFRNPRDAPEKYPNGVTCEARLSSAAPRYLRILPKLLNFQNSDRLVIKGPFRYKVVIKKPFSGPAIYIPSTYAKIYFKTKDKKRNVFRLTVASKTNNCQRMCKVSRGSTGAVRHGPYKADTFCEWWLEAPEECIIRLRFVKFNVGNAGSGGAWGCSGDYVGVDRGGDPTYAHPNSRTFCGSTLPKGVRSIANKLNVLFNGPQGGYQGFRAIYKVFCPGGTSENPISDDNADQTTSITKEMQPWTTTISPPNNTLENIERSTTDKPIDVSTSTTKIIDRLTTTQRPIEILTEGDYIISSIINNETHSPTTTVSFDGAITTTKKKEISTNGDFIISSTINDGAQSPTTTVIFDGTTTTTKQNEILTNGDFIISSTITDATTTLSFDGTTSTEKQKDMLTTEDRITTSVLTVVPLTTVNQIIVDTTQVYTTTEGSPTRPIPENFIVLDDFAEEEVEWDDDEWLDEWDEGWEEEDYEYSWDEEEWGEAWGDGWGEEDYEEYDY